MHVKGKQEFAIKKKPPQIGRFELSNVSNKRFSKIIEASGVLSSLLHHLRSAADTCLIVWPEQKGG